MSGTEFIIYAIAATAASVYASESQRKQVKAAADAENKERQAEAKALNRQAQINMARQRKLNRAILARQEAESVAAGVDTGTGTPLERLANNAATLEVQAIEQFREKTDLAEQRKRQGLLALAKGKSKASALRMESVSSVISGASSVYGASKSMTQPKTTETTETT